VTGFTKVLQTGGHTISNKTSKALGLTKEEAKRAMERFKLDGGRPSSNHNSQIWGNGDVTDRATNKLIGNLIDGV